MPKLNNRNPKLGKLKSYAIVRYGGKIHYLGKHGTAEALSAYNRFCAEIQSNPTRFTIQNEEVCVTVKELAAAYLDHCEAVQSYRDFHNTKTAILDFLLPLYGDSIKVDKFSPKCLRLVRDAMVESERFCRNVVNRHAKVLLAMFQWGVAEEIVPPSVPDALKYVKALPKGYPGTFENPEREPVDPAVVMRTLPFMPPVLRAMVQIQGMLGMRPSEVFKITVGSIDRSKEKTTGLWYYNPAHHKTEEHIGKKPLPLGIPEQELIAPYLIDKNPEEAVFSPRTAEKERAVEKRANRKSKITPSQRARDERNAQKPSKKGEFYDANSYRKAIGYAIKKGNKAGVEIPHWYPYQLRHAAATAIEESDGLDAAQAQLGHTTADMTKRYSKAALKTREKLARNRRNPFDTDGQGKDAA